MLIEAGANVNSRNKRDVTPLIVAGVKGHVSVVRVLVAQPNIRLSDQVGRVGVFLGVAAWEVVMGMCGFYDVYI